MTSPKEQHPKDELTVGRLDFLDKLHAEDDGEGLCHDWPLISAAARKGIEAQRIFEEIDECFEAALVEGWIDSLAEGDIERIRDIYNRRIAFVRCLVLPSPPEQTPSSTEEYDRVKISGPAVDALENRKDGHCPFCMRPWDERCSCIGIDEHGIPITAPPVAAPDQEGVCTCSWKTRCSPSDQKTWSDPCPVHGAPSPQEPQLTNEDLAVGFAGIKDGKKITAAEFYEADRGEADIQQPQADVEALPLRSEDGAPVAAKSYKLPTPQEVLLKTALADAKRGGAPDGADCCYSPHTCTKPETLIGLIDLITALSKERDDWRKQAQYEDKRRADAQAELSAIKQENERLTKALKPFAAQADEYDDEDDPDDQKIDDLGVADITIGHCRKARAALPSEGA